MKLSGPVEGENVPEDVRIAVEEVLAAVLVVEELLLVGAEQRLRELLERVAPRLEPPAGNVDQQLLIRDVVYRQVLRLDGWKRGVALCEVNSSENSEILADEK